MNTRVLASFIGLWLVAFSAAGAWATIIHLSKAEGRYFTVLDDSSSDDTFAPSWRWWLRVHRTIKANPRLARRFAAQPLDLSSHDWSFKNGNEKLREFGLKSKQIEGQPAHVYTLHIASFRQQSSLVSFFREHWLSRGMERRRVYKSISKGLRLFVFGEFTSKSDPLYSRLVVVQGQNMLRLNYGVYENIADANADRRVLERHLGLHVEVLQEHVTKEFIRRVWLEPVAGKHFTKWEAKS